TDMRWPLSSGARERCSLLRAVSARVSLIVCFFFQAEDGIRDRNVTGVQTCALPISRTGTVLDEIIAGVLEDLEPRRARRSQHDRSEERRVGKERRPRGAKDREKKKQGSDGAIDSRSNCDDVTTKWPTVRISA